VTPLLLKEIICQRHAQDYQNIIISNPQNNIHYFSNRNQVHEILLDKNSKVVEVKRYLNKRVLREAQLVKFQYK
jgi:hypothetical protein